MKYNRTIKINTISESQLREFQRGIDYEKLFLEAVVSIAPRGTRAGLARRLGERFKKSLNVWK